MVLMNVLPPPTVPSEEMYVMVAFAVFVVAADCCLLFTKIKCVFDSMKSDEENEDDECRSCWSSSLVALFRFLRLSIVITERRTDGGHMSSTRLMTRHSIFLFVTHSLASYGSYRMVR
jgi:hypothetical protein